MAGFAVAADFGAADLNADAAFAFDLLLQLFVEAAFEFADFAAAQAGDVDMVAGAVAFVIVAVAAEMEQVEFVDQTVALEEIDGAVNGDAMDAGIDFVSAFEDFIGIEMALGGIHDLDDDAALAGETHAALFKFGFEPSDVLIRVDALAAGDAAGWCGCHRVKVSPARE